MTSTKTDSTRRAFCRAIANIFRIRAGWGEPIASDPSLGLVENFVHMLGVPGRKPSHRSDLLRPPHGPRRRQLLTFGRKAAASGHADHISSSSDGRPLRLLHGRANQECLNFVKSVGTTDPDEIEQFVRDTLRRRQDLGFGTPCSAPRTRADRAVRSGSRDLRR